MRLKEISKFNAPPAEEIASLLQKNCASWLSQVGNKLVYRGIKLHAYDDFEKRKTPVNKSDPDIPEGLQTRIDQLLEQQGFTALIKNSIHITGRKTRAEAYGNAYVIFPIGPFNFTWSPKAISVMGYLFSTGKKSITIQEYVATCRNDSIREAIDSGHEIFLSSNYHYRIDTDLFEEQVLPLLF